MKNGQTVFAKLAIKNNEPSPHLWIFIVWPTDKKCGVALNLTTNHGVFETWREAQSLSIKAGIKITDTFSTSENSFVPPHFVESVTLDYAKAVLKNGQDYGIICDGAFRMLVRLLCPARENITDQNAKKLIDRLCNAIMQESKKPKSGFINDLEKVSAKPAQNKESTNQAEKSDSKSD